MSEQFSREELIAAMVARDVPLAKAQAFADQREAARLGFTPSTTADIAPVAREIAFPVRLTLRWSALCSDNTRERASIIMMGDKPTPRKLMDARFKMARERVILAAKEVMDGCQPTAGLLALVAKVWVPDERTHDVCNFAKGVHDALQKIVYVNDSQLHDTRWIRAGVDVDSPRAEIEIRLYVSG